MKSVFKRALLASLLVGAGVVVCAQGMGGAMGGMDGPMAGAHYDGWHRGMHTLDPAKMQKIIAKHQAALKAKLKITPDQESAWATFTASAKPLATMGQRVDPAEMQKLTTPERIDKMRALRSERLAEMDKHADAVKVFYAALTPEQRKVFDAEHMRHDRTRGMWSSKGASPPQ